MPSSYTTSLRLEMQAAGENLNTWGAPKLNTVISRIDKAIAGFTTVALTANTTLTSSNTADDQSRSAMLKFTGTGAFTVTAPAVSKQYTVWNATTGDLTLTMGSGTSVVISTGEINTVICDGSAGFMPLGVGGESWKAYVDEQAFAALAGDLPGQTGNSGKVLSTDGTTAGWASAATLPDVAAKFATLEAQSSFLFCLAS